MPPLPVVERRRRLPTAATVEFNKRWTTQPVRNGTYSFVANSSSSMAVWHSPRNTDLLHEEPRNPPPHYHRDKLFLEQMRDGIAGFQPVLLNAHVNQPSRRQRVVRSVEPVEKLPSEASKERPGFDPRFEGGIYKTEKQRREEKMIAERRKQQAANRRLIADLRRSMRDNFKDTANLPINLWNSFKRTDRMLFNLADKDGGGSIDFNEFLNTLVGNLVKI